MTLRECFTRLFVGALLCVTSSFPLVSHAQPPTITADGTAVGLTTTVNQAGIDYQINGGTVNGSNQFYSFSELSVPSFGSADFQAANAGIQNILGRVTGGGLSTIDGTLTSTITGAGGLSNANLFLLNPAGILFGNNAQLDLGGSFHASTADYISLGNPVDGVFSMNDATTVLSASPPSAFGFLNAPPGPGACPNSCITVGSNQFTDLHVVNDQTLSLVGGPIMLGTAADGSAPATLLALDAPRDQYLNGTGRMGGRVNLVSVASAGDALFDGTNVDVTQVSQLGDILIQGETIIDAGEVYIRGGQLTIENSFVFPGGISRIFGAFVPPNGGTVDVMVTNDMTISADARVFGFNSGIRSLAGPIDDSDPANAFDAADITIRVGSLTLDGPVRISSERFGPGTAADIDVVADSLTFLDGAGISLFNFFRGAGGTISVDATDVSISTANGNITGINAQSQFHPLFLSNDHADPENPGLTSAAGGMITIEAPGSLMMSGDGVQITTDSSNFGSGGDIVINAGDVVLSDNAVIAAESKFAGDAGNITIHADRTIQLQDGSQISASTAGTGDAGLMDLAAGQGIILTGSDSAMFNNTVPPLAGDLDDLAQTYAFGSFEELQDFLKSFGVPADNFFEVLEALTLFGVAENTDFTVGDAGTISITAPQLALNGRSRIDALTTWDGNGGEVIANADNVTLTGGGAIRSRSGAVRLLTGLPEVGAGDGGTVTVNATDTISISGTGSTISTTTFGDGNGGSVVLNAGNGVTIEDGGNVSADSGGELAGQEFSGTGFTGDINITAGTDIVLDGGIISTRAVTSDGGNIKLTAPNIVELVSSQITTSVESGVGGGGNINIDPEFIVLNNSQITANAFGGPGGNISLTANNFVPSADSTVQASSALSTQGTIVIASPENNIAGAIAQLPQDIIDTSGLLPERCAARTAGGAQSSFVVAGRGGLPTNPDNYLPSFSAGSVPLKRAGGLPSDTMEAALTSARDIAVAMAAWNCSPGSERSVPVNEVISQLF